MELKLYTYNFATNDHAGRLHVSRQPTGWEVHMPSPDYRLKPMGRAELTGTLRVPVEAGVRDGWVVLEASGDSPGHAVLAFRVLVADEEVPSRQR